MTAVEFEQDYAVNTYGVAVVEFRALGFVIVHCHCGEERCPGWRPMHPQAELAAAMNEIGECASHVLAFADLLSKTLSAVAMKYFPQATGEGFDAALLEFARARMGKVQ
jgi:hypothetical protein